MRSAHMETSQPTRQDSLGGRLHIITTIATRELGRQTPTTDAHECGLELIKLDKIPKVLVYNDH